MAHDQARARGGRMLKESGYSVRPDKAHPDKAQDAKLIVGAIKQHDAHPRAKLKLKKGGKVAGKKSSERPDRRARGGFVAFDQPDDADGNMVKDSGRARGGKVGKKGKVVINIQAGGGGQDAEAAHQAGLQQGAMMGAKAAAAKMAGGAGGPPPGGPPPGAMPPRPPMAGPGGPPPPGMAGPPGAPPMGPGGPPPMHARGGAMRRADGGKVNLGAGPGKSAPKDPNYMSQDDLDNLSEFHRFNAREDYAQDKDADDGRARGGAMRNGKGRFSGGAV